MRRSSLCSPGCPLPRSQPPRSVTAHHTRRRRRRPRPRLPRCGRGHLHLHRLPAMLACMQVASPRQPPPRLQLTSQPCQLRMPRRHRPVYSISTCMQSQARARSVAWASVAPIPRQACPRHITITITSPPPPAPQVTLPLLARRSRTRPARSPKKRRPPPPTLARLRPPRGSCSSLRGCSSAPWQARGYS